MDALVAQDAQPEAGRLRLEQEAAAAAAPVGDEALRLEELAAAGVQKLRLNEEAATAEKAQAEPLAAPASADSKATGDLFGRQTKWKEICDGASGKVYYYNAETGETTWDREAQRTRVIPRGKASYPLFRGWGTIDERVYLKMHSTVKNRNISKFKVNIIVLALQTLVLLGPAEMPAEVATAAVAGASGETNPSVAPKQDSWDM